MVRVVSGGVVINSDASHDCLETPVSRTAVRLIGGVFPVRKVACMSCNAMLGKLSNKTGISHGQFPLWELAYTAVRKDRPGDTGGGAIYLKWESYFK